MRRFIFAVVAAVGLCSPSATGQQPPLRFGDRFAKPQAVTVRGVALNQDGEPVAGAKVYVLSTNRLQSSSVDPVVGHGVTDAKGAYAIERALLPILAPDGPIHKHPEGAYQVYATAEGYGFTWRSEQLVRSEKRPPDSDAGPNLFYEGEDCVADLKFEPPATIQGRLTSDRGEPLAGVRVEIGYVHDINRANGFGSSSCRYLGPPQAGVEPPPDRFSGMGQVPESMRAAITDADGRYSLTGLRRETAYSILIDYRPEVDPLATTVATATVKRGNAQRWLGYEGRLDHAFIAPRSVSIEVTASEQGQPVAGATVRAIRSRLLRGGNVATTDASGKAELQLPPDEYSLLIEPALGAPYLPGEAVLSVAKDVQASPVKVTLEPAAVATLSAVDEAGQPVAGVSFVQEASTGSGKRQLARQPLHSQTVVADYPTTDDRGTLLAVLKPGQVRFVVDQMPPGYEAVRPASSMLELEAGKTTEVPFEFRKTATAAAAPPADPQDELSALRERLAAQRALSKSGTYRIRHGFMPSGAAAPDEVIKAINGWNPSAGADFFEYLKSRLPNVRFIDVENTVVIDGLKHRVESPVEIKGERRGTRLSVANGHENVRLDPVNGQASLSPGMVGQTRQGFSPRPDVFYTSSSITSRFGASRGKPEVTREAGKLTLKWEVQQSTATEILDEQTGFLQHSSAKTASGFGREAWYFWPRQTERGVQLAGLAIQLQYQGDKLLMMEANQLESVTLEKPSPLAFVVSAPAGTNLVDQRQLGLRAKVKRISHPVADVVIAANQIPDDDRAILPVLKKGQPAPPLEPLLWLNAAGQTPAPEMKGKIVLIDFWGIWCGPCVAELPNVQTLAKELASDDFLLVGLHESRGELLELAEFAQKRSLLYQLAIDRPATDGPSFGATFKAYGIRGIPSCAVIDRQGRIAYIGDLDQAAREAARLLKGDR